MDSHQRDRGDMVSRHHWCFVQALPFKEKVVVLSSETHKGRMRASSWLLSVDMPQKATLVRILKRMVMNQSGMLEFQKTVSSCGT